MANLSLKLTVNYVFSVASGAYSCRTVCCDVQSAKRRWFANEMPSSRHDYVSEVLHVFDT